MQNNAHDDDIGIAQTDQLSTDEKIVLLGLANGQNPTALKKALNCDNMQLRTLEINLMHKLKAKTKTHLIARAFTLSILFARTLCLIILLSITYQCVVVDTQDFTRTSRSGRSSRTARSARTRTRGTV